MSAGLKRVAAAVARAPGSFVSPVVEARAIPGMGVGVVATDRIPAGELVFRASRAAWQPFSAEHALEAASKQAPGFLRQLDALVAGNRALQAEDSFVPNALVLGAHLLVNFPHAEDPNSVLHAVGKDSFGRSVGLEELYVNALPRHVDLPLYWDEQQLAALEGCADVARSIQQSARFYLQVHRHLFGADNALVSLEAFFWAVTVLMSRATSGRQQPFTLIPFFDWFNHSDRGHVDLNPAYTSSDALTCNPLLRSRDECEHGYEADTGSFTVHTTRGYAAGEQLCISYGRHSNVRLMRNYGFALPHNPHDVVELPLPRELQAVSPNDPAIAQKLELLEALRLPGVALRQVPGSAQSLPFKRSVRLLPDGQLALESRQWLEILLASPKELQQLVEAVTSGAGRVEGGELAFPEAVGAKVSRHVIAMANDRFGQHKTSLEDDERFLLANEHQLAPWLRSCLYVRTGEKRILEAVKGHYAATGTST